MISQRKWAPNQLETKIHRNITTIKELNGHIPLQFEFTHISNKFKDTFEEITHRSEWFVGFERLE